MRNHLSLIGSSLIGAGIALVGVYALQWNLARADQGASQTHRMVADPQETPPTRSFDSPVSPGAFALGAGAKFIARAIDVDKAGLGSVLEAAHGFDGAAFVEIFQNCIVYNDGVFNSFTERDKAADAQLRVEHGKPLVFGEGGSKGLAFDVKTMALKIVDAKVNAGEVLVHDETNRTLAQLLLTMPQPEFPVALGVVLRQPGVAFEKAYYANQPTKLKRTGKVADALRQTSIWRVPAAKQA